MILMNEESLVKTLCVPDYGACQPQPTLRTSAAGSLFYSAYSAMEIEEGLQANVSVMKKL